MEGRGIVPAESARAGVFCWHVRRFTAPVLNIGMLSYWRYTSPMSADDPTQRVAALAAQGLRAREIAAQLAREREISRRDAYTLVLSALGRT